MNDKKLKNAKLASKAVGVTLVIISQRLRKMFNISIITLWFLILLDVVLIRFFNTDINLLLWIADAVMLVLMLLTIRNRCSTYDFILYDKYLWDVVYKNDEQVFYNEPAGNAVYIIDRMRKLCARSLMDRKSRRLARKLGITDDILLGGFLDEDFGWEEIIETTFDAVPDELLEKMIK